LNDLKEQAEHATIVDLLRNDLSKVAEKVESEKIQIYRPSLYAPERIVANEFGNYRTTTGKLLFSSGRYHFSMLPAGSISGAPKRKTIEIIREVEEYERGFYTGIFGQIRRQKSGFGCNDNAI